MGQKLSKYEQQINQLIEPATMEADAITLREYPDVGKRIVGGSRMFNAVKISQMSVDERQKYIDVADYWNRQFHANMNRLAREAGIRSI